MNIYIYDSWGKLKLLKLLSLLLFHTGMGSMSSKCVQPYLIAMDFVTLKIRFLNYKTDFVNGFAHIKFFLIRLKIFSETLFVLSGKSSKWFHQTTA